MPPADMAGRRLRCVWRRRRFSAGARTRSLGSSFVRSSGELMTRFIVCAVLAGPVLALAQEAASPAATAGDIESLRQQVQALTDTVKTLQQQVKDQQAALDKANISATPALPQASPPPAAGGTTSVSSQTNAASPPTAGSPSASPPPLI